MHLSKKWPNPFQIEFVIHLHGIVVVTICDVIGCDEQVWLVKSFGVGQTNLDQKLSIRVNIPFDLVLRFRY
jgi:hypothetical protein